MQQIITLLGSIETELQKIHTTIPHLPLEWKNLLTKALPYLVAIGGVLSIMSLLSLLHLFSVPMVPMYGYGMWGTYMILTLISSTVTALVAFLAFPKLQKNQKLGWTYVFGASLIGGIINILMFSVGGIVGTCIGLYLLFEVRENYKN